ncbi:MAG: ribulose-phosphate 3-epimerase [Dehalococcoidia bacterium]|nr:MAG: ribulose-phosphate 3-epimerase [Dehalococcoidia bacterium]
MINGVKLAPSVLAADYARLGEQVQEAKAAGADYIHVDVMDGHFVPNITVGPLVVEGLRRLTDLPLDVHLMIEEPERHIEAFAKAGASILTVHPEASSHVHRLVQMIKSLDVRSGVGLNPASPLALIEEVLAEVDLVLLMTVNPGWGGQAFLRSVLPKMRQLRRMLDEQGLAAELEVDGGITAETAPLVVEAGARVLVAGSAVFQHSDGVAAAMARIHESVRRVRPAV